jgi:calcium/calmodulin-dependent protein kinase I
MKSITKAMGDMLKYKPRHTKTEFEKRYKVGKLLGTGNFAEVKLATKRDTNKRVAVKIIDKTRVEGKEGMLESELNIMKKAQHPNIVGLLDDFDTVDKLYLVLELVEGGELFDRIVNKGSFTERDASRITRQMSSAVGYLHSLDIVHRDLKPENLLFRTEDPDSDIMVADFGLSKLINDDMALETACGTPNYVAPEILEQKGYGKAVDMWSVGIITYIMLCGYPPFHHDNDTVLFKKIMSGVFQFDQAYWSAVSDSAKDLISKLLVVDPKKRLTAEQVLEHPWVSGKTAADTSLDSVATRLSEYRSARGRFKKAVNAVNAINAMKRMTAPSEDGPSS